MSLSTKPRSTNIATHKLTRQEAYDAAMVAVDGGWDDFMSNPAVHDRVKVATAKLYAEIVPALTAVQSEADVAQLRASFSKPVSAETGALISAISDLSPATQDMLLRTLEGVKDGTFQMSVDGQVRKPRPATPPGLPAAPAATAPAALATPAPAAPATPAPTAAAPAATPAPATAAPAAPAKRVHNWARRPK